MPPPGVDDTKTNIYPVGKVIPSPLLEQLDLRYVGVLYVAGIRFTETDKVSKTFSKEFNIRMAQEQQFSNCDQQTSVD